MASGGFQIPGLNMLSGSSAVPTTTAPSTSQATDPSQPTTAASHQVPPAAEQSNDTPAADEMVVDTAHTTSTTTTAPEPATNDAPSPPSLTSGLEALLGGIDPEPLESTNDAMMTDDQPTTAPAGDAPQPEEAEHPEWEEDSSPYESSSDSSSDSDSSSEDEDGNPILGPEETARILMEMDGGSDDEGGRGGKGSSAAALRTKNELMEAILPKPDITITPKMELRELGVVEHIIENTIVIQAGTTGEVEILEPGFPICNEARVVIAAIMDVIGSVRQPRYTAMFTGEEEIQSLGLAVGVKVFYPPQHAVSVMTQPLRKDKGTDASNWHDEEAGVDEIEFSDDEKEAEYKRQLKAKKKAGRGGKAGDQSGRQQGGEAGPSGANAGGSGLNYDDEGEDEGPYRKLARPSTFGHGGGGSLDEVNTGAHFQRGGHRGGRGDRGRGRGRGGDRGRGGARGGGGYSGGPSGHSLPPKPPGGQAFNNPQGSTPQQFAQQQQTPQAPFNFIPPMPFGNTAFPPPLPPPGQAGAAAVPPFPFPAWPQGGQNFVPPPPPPPGQAGAAGAYYNPAFLAALQSQLQQNQQQQGQQQGSYGQQPGNQQWPGQQGHQG